VHQDERHEAESWPRAEVKKPSDDSGGEQPDYVQGEERVLFRRAFHVKSLIALNWRSVACGSLPSASGIVAVFLKVTLPPSACLTLDLEPDHAGRAVFAYEAWRPDRLDALMDLLDEFEAPLSAFVVGQSLEQQPSGIAHLRRRGVDFHLHSYSHNLAEPDSAAEIDAGMRVFEAVFGAPPKGYRAPEGRISEGGLSRLSGRGFLFDSSVFPAAWPHPRYLRYPRKAYRSGRGGLVEIPVATAGPARIPVTLSFIKLLGFPLYRRLIRPGNVPDPLVFDMHLHDLFVLPAYDQLPAFLKVAYSRNRAEGFALLRSTLTLLRDSGYRFTSMSAAARDLDKALPRC
jgi:peptidoglycan/xylan/chitin deacetylase (PgdA/CDA1 family)